MSDHAVPADQVARALDPNKAEPVGRPVCPHCGGERTSSHGSFARKDGTRQLRRLCRTCGRTFNQNTGTPIHYIKKRTEWRRLPLIMALSASVRRTAAVLRISNDTSFRWRHRLLAAISSRPQPTLSGKVGAGEAYIPYSEKGSHGTGGPGARRGGSAVALPRFRRFVDGKPSCVLLACSELAWVSSIVGAGRPAVAALRACIRQIVVPGTVLQATGLVPYVQACKGLGIDHCDTGNSHAPGVDNIRYGLYTWLVRFHGVATRYLEHYLAWHRVVGRPARLGGAA